MTFCRSVLATLCLAALALAGCSQDTQKGNEEGSEGRRVGGFRAQLTLPDDSEVDSVDFNITGGPMGFAGRMGSVPVGNSTILTFRIGGLPVGPDYNIELSAETSYGNSCSGDADFDILDNQTTLVSVTLVCGATDDVGDIIVEGEFQSCPIITAITAIPGEITLGNTIALSADISHGTNPVHWSGAGGTFGTPDDYATGFTCVDAGPHQLTVAVNTTDCHDARTVDVICTLGAGCGNGAMDPGEECDDGNTDSTDACTAACQIAECGDNFIQTGVETCDDDNNITEECAYGVASCTVCNSTCQSVAGDTDICGDGTPDAPTEGCDDGNTTTEECAYGSMSCTVCSATCTSVAGETDFCGDMVVDPGEDCDGTPGCSMSCTSTPDTCTPCRVANCTSYLGISGYDVYNGCLSAALGDAARMDFGAVITPDEMTFVQQCVDVVNCSQFGTGVAPGSTGDGCGNDPARGPAGPCYCGSRDNTTCQSMGPGPDAPCRTQWEAAVRSTVVADVFARAADPTYPAGWAFALLECDTTFCTGCQP